LKYSFFFLPIVEHERWRDSDIAHCDWLAFYVWHKWSKNPIKIKYTAREMTQIGINKNRVLIPNFRPKRSTPPKTIDIHTKSKVTKSVHTPKANQNNFPIISAVISASSIVGVDPKVNLRQN